jgi:hypothetical protein
MIQFLRVVIFNILAILAGYIALLFLNNFIHNSKHFKHFFY